MTKYILLLSLLSVTGCYETQTTSGKQYLQGYAKPPQSELDKEVYDAANVEPNLKFPARIGLARIDNGSITAIPAEELSKWNELTEELGSEFGEFIPVSRLIATMVAPPKSKNNKWQQSSEERLNEIIRSVRLGAARQHLDVFFMYEVYGTSKSYLNPASITNITIIGAYLAPGRSINVKGFASGLLLDVRNGYPYGTAESKVSDKELSTSINSYQNQMDLTENSKIAAAIKLVSEAKSMLLDLKSNLTK